MAMRMLIDASHPEETRVVVIDGTKIEEYDFESTSKQQLKGNVYLAKVTRVEPSLQAAFVEYGGNRHGFLAFSEIHPDYYRIPVEDRERLLEEEFGEGTVEALAEADAPKPEPSRRGRKKAAPSEQETGEDGEKPTRKRRSRRSRRKTGEGDQAEAADSGNDDAATAATDAPSDADGGPSAANPDTAGPETSGPDAQDASDGNDTAQDASDRNDAEDEASDRDSAPDDGDSAADEQSDDDGPHKTVTMATDRGEESVSQAASPFRDPRDSDEDEEEEDDAPTGKMPPANPADLARAHDPAELSDNGGNGDGNGDGPPPLGPEDRDSAEDGDITKAPASAEAEARGDVESVGGDEVEEMAARRSRRPKRVYKIQEVIKRRQILLVQVNKEERGNKGAALSTYLSLAGRYCVLMPNTPRGGGVSRKISNPADRKKMKALLDELDLPPGMAVILRTAGLERTKTEIKRDLDYLLRLWDQIREKTLSSIAPCLIHEEANLIKRAIRDLYSKDIEEILVEGDEGYRIAKDFMKMLMPSHAKKVKLYKDEFIPMFHRYQVEQQMEAMLTPTVQLKSGGYIVINPTEALVAIDVNSGRATKERNIEETAYRTNLEAAEEIARQLRLRDLAGLVVIDFIDMEEDRHNAAVERKLKEAMKSDRARIQVGRISPFGLLELSRQRLRPSLMETHFEVSPYCGGTGMIRTVESSTLHVLRAVVEEGIRKRSAEILVRVPLKVALYLLNQKRDALREIEARYEMRVLVEEDRDLYAPNFTIEKLRSLAEGPSIMPSVLSSATPAVSAAQVQDEADEAAEAEEADEAEDAADAPKAATGDSGGDDEGRRKRRPRRRRKSGDEDGARGGDSDATAKDEPAETVGDGDSGSEDGPADQQAGGDDEDSDEARRRKRRRGKRGGRRRRPGRGDEENGTAEAGANGGGNSGTVTGRTGADPTDGGNADNPTDAGNADNLTDAGNAETASQGGTDDADPGTGSADPAMAATAADAPGDDKPASAMAEPAASEPVAEAVAPAESESADPVAATASEVPAETPADGQAAPDESDENPAAKDAETVNRAPEKPRRGWWQRVLPGGR